MYLLLAIVHNIVFPGYKDITLHIFFLVLFGNLKCFPVYSAFLVFVWTAFREAFTTNVAPQSRALEIEKLKCPAIPRPRGGWGYKRLVHKALATRFRNQV